ncbi:uroporphyrinogen decarboxylase [Actinomyces faecalis]|uniref:uroporphyrinogen decarboxylase n=1 Tax=Actinomyces faecalis TaxID=2722820 RepID=UPI001553E29C|nr:uroporphyrinogen decarboxylase family protein [Actinomyces faecalis]
MTTPAHNSFDRSSSPAPALLEALRGHRPPRTPVWFMRQAGRSLPEYRAMRAEVGLEMLEVCLRPELAAEATLQPVRRHGVDAAVFFSDIMVPLRLAGVGVRIEPGVGPVIDRPVRTHQDVYELVSHRYGEDGYAAGVEAVSQGVRAVVAELGTPERPGSDCVLSPRGRQLGERELAGLAHSRGEHGWTPVIGFGGAPFTLAAYLVEGRPSRDHLAARTLMHADPEAWHALMTWCAEVSGQFIATQVEAGASAAQLFDSWAGSLAPADYRRAVAPYSAQALEHARQAVSSTTGASVPLIHFGTGTARILADMRQAGADAVGVDDRTDLGEAIEDLSTSPDGPCPVQGSLDPALLAAPAPVLAAAVDRCLALGRRAPGHVVNLGHGVPASTDPAVLTTVVAQVHADRQWAEVAALSWQGPEVQA